MRTSDGKEKNRTGPKGACLDSGGCSWELEWESGWRALPGHLLEWESG